MALWSIGAEHILHYVPDSRANRKYSLINAFPLTGRCIERVKVVSAADYVSKYSQVSFCRPRVEGGPRYLNAIR